MHSTVWTGKYVWQMATIFISDSSKVPRHISPNIFPHLKLLYHVIFLHNSYHLAPYIFSPQFPRCSYHSCEIAFCFSGLRADRILTLAWKSICNLSIYDNDIGVDDQAMTAMVLTPWFCQYVFVFTYMYIQV